ncbi:MAG: ligase-associated DNA damage response endonuclease PdeM [Phycisphaerae bacterium]|nr:ligase-associated DNA damage response endonuclease PdeM [Gemmatimonadaceae bacterium]
MHPLNVAGEQLFLSAHHALFIPRFSTLVVADLHWGKAATFRATGVPLPPGVTASDLERLTQVLTETSAERLLIVGDLLHARAGRHERTLNAIAEWRAQHQSLQMVLVRGNHDAHAGDPPSALNIECVDGPLLVGAFACQHHPNKHATHYVLAGHLHPHVRLHGRGRQNVRLPCFAFCDRGAVLPAFTAFTGGGAYTPSSGDRIFAIADGEIIPADVRS